MKKPQTPGRSTQYLLNVDRTLRKLSLRKIPVHVKKATKRVQSRSAKKSVARATKKSPGAPATTGWPTSRAVVYALVGIVAVATLIGVPSLFQRSDSTIAAEQSGTSASATTPPSARPFNTTKGAVKPVAVGATSRRQIESAQTPVVASAAQAEPMTSGAVTISGCLQGADDSFWLKDTEGADAPRARSWKSGFLKKHSASIQVVDAVDTLNLSKHVGQRVTATGRLANRTMQARSLQRVAASCN